MTLTREEQMMKDIESKYYMKPILRLIKQNSNCTSAKKIKEDSDNCSTFFVMPDFYGEIERCRKKLEGAFDYVFVGKNVQPNNVIKSLGEIVDVVNRLLA